MPDFAPDQERLTPSSLPTRYVTAPAPPPIASMRRPSRAALRPVNRLIVAPRGSLSGVLADLRSLQPDLVLVHFALRTHRNVLPRGHRKSAREQAGDPREEDESGVRGRSCDTEDKTQVRHQPVVDPEYRRAQVS